MGILRLISGGHRRYRSGGIMRENILNLNQTGDPCHATQAAAVRPTCCIAALCDRGAIEMAE